MANYTQDNRPMRVETPLGKDVLLLQSFEGGESVSDLFGFDLTMLSTNHDLPLDSLIGENSTIVVALPDKKSRIINGIISEFRHTGTFVLQDGLTPSIFSQYQARLVPWFWTLKLNKDCRIFQNKSVPQIVREIFGEHSLAEFEMRLSDNYAVREYCVQYRESDFNFVSRLLEEEGIFYFFEHSAKKHKLILADNPTQFKPLPHQSKIDFASASVKDEDGIFMTGWQANRQMCSEKFELRDFNFRMPLTDLTSNLKSKKSRGRDLEIYDYPGEYESRDVGDKLTRIRFEEEKTRELIIQAQTNGRGFITGSRFELKRHPRKNFNREYVVLKAECRASQTGNFRSSSAAEAFNFECQITCLPYPTNFRPPRRTAIPKVQGTQTAIIVGPKGEEIFTDKHGRVKVQFHWDRLGHRNENSSCWIRVSQPWAGTGFGGVTIPRIGQEVIVDFLEGDPDKPIITGRVYNGASRPPYELPANKAHSGLMSRSTPKGGSDNFNGIRMDDGIGAEGLEIQAEKDQRILVKNDKAETVGNNETVQIGNNRVEIIGQNATETVGVAKVVDVGETILIKAGTSITLECGAARIHMNQAGFVTITGTVISTAAAVNASMIAPMTEIVGGILLVERGGAVDISGGVCTINAAERMTASGKEIVVKAAENVDINGTKVNINC